MGDTCVICATTTDQTVCDGCRTRIRTHLTALPDRVADLTHHLVPLRTAAQERVTQTRGGSPTGARLDVLTLTGPGNEAPTTPRTAPQPVVRRWSEQVTVDVDVPRLIPLAGVTLVRERRTVTVWHEAPVLDTAGNPVVAYPDDQVGMLPPAVWLDAWTRAWRTHFGHHTRPPHPPAHHPPSLDRWVVLWYATRPAAAPLLAALATVVGAWRTYQGNTILGQFPGHAGRRPPAGERRDDPVTDEWVTRFGTAPPPAGVAADVTYLLTWLDAACDQDVGVRDFAAELAALTGHLVGVLGERPDQQWLGRCPAQLTDPTGATRLCGGGLWQDAYASQVQCPRCRTTWGPARRDLLYLAVAIRRCWPLDRRRRYSTLQRPERVGCPACRAPVEVGWREVTATVDTQRWWQPVRVVCPAGCPEAERLLC